MSNNTLHPSSCSCAFHIYIYKNIHPTKGVSHPCCPWTLQAEQYIDERHRHRYEVNPEMVEELEAAGLRFVGRDETGVRMEIVELGPEHDHPFFVGAQFHPEVSDPKSCRILPIWLF